MAKTQKVRTTTANGKIQVSGYLYGGRRAGKGSYLKLKTTDGKVVDYIDGASLVRLARAIVDRYDGL